MKILQEIKDVMRFFNGEKDNRQLVFYSESSIYYLYYQEFIENILAESDVDIYYITSDINDAIFKQTNPRIKVFYINQLLPFVFPFIDAKALVMTMPDLEKYHIKRSKNYDVEYIYVFHAMMSTHMAYREGAFDHYDTIFCVGQYHKEEIRATERMYNLKEKRLISVGYPLLERMHKTYSQIMHRTSAKKERLSIVIAPSWFQGNILESCIVQLVDELLKQGHQVTVRPHPQFVRLKLDIVEEIKKRYNMEARFKLESNLVSNESVVKADILITDWSGIAFEFAWAMEKPVLFVDTVKKINNPEYERIGIEPLESKVRKKIGKVLKFEEICNINTIINEILDDRDSFIEGIIKEREDNIYNWGNSGKVGADYIIQQLKNK